MKRVWMSWSSGKDCAWALYLLRHTAGVEVTGLFTTMNEAFDRVAMHAVRRSLVEAQAASASLPLETIPLPWPCSNEEYEARMRLFVDRALRAGVTHMAFGDLFLEDVRDYRISRLAGTGIEPLFPVWGKPADTPSLARTMIEAGVRAVITCVDPQQVPESLAGRSYDDSLLADLPSGADPCGERGEFHTFCIDGPMFAWPIEVEVGEIVTRDGFRFADLVPR